MAASPRFKVYTPEGEYVASCHYASDAGAIVNLYGDGATIRDGHRKANVVWTEGSEEQPAGESYDFVVETVMVRLGYTAYRVTVGGRQ